MEIELMGNKMEPLAFRLRIYLVFWFANLLRVPIQRIHFPPERVGDAVCGENNT